ncbi:hypothetical protein [Sphingobacterium cellulitidis]|uniref:hypothetical protein n=1 Tax=Sphingobacterium cellulitidis TaxID=1768011 RepID=UPI00146DB49B
MSKTVENENFVVATKEGRLYIKTSDFFKQAKIRETIEKLKNSKVVREIDEKNKLAGT